MDFTEKPYFLPKKTLENKKNNGFREKSKNSSKK